MRDAAADIEANIPAIDVQQFSDRKLVVRPQRDVVAGRHNACRVHEQDVHRADRQVVGVAELDRLGRAGRQRVHVVFRLIQRERAGPRERQSGGDDHIVRGLRGGSADVQPQVAGNQIDVVVDLQRRVGLKLHVIAAGRDADGRNGQAVHRPHDQVVVVAEADRRGRAGGQRIDVVGLQRQRVRTVTAQLQRGSENRLGLSHRASIREGHRAGDRLNAGGGDEAEATGNVADRDAESIAEFDGARRVGFG